MHLYFRCIDSVVRLYFTFETTIKGYQENRQPEGGEMKLYPKFEHNFILLADGKPVRYNSWFGGADAQIDVRHKHKSDVLEIGVRGWQQYTAFPISECTATSPTIIRNNNSEKSNTDPVYHPIVVHTHYADIYHDVNRPIFIDALAKHLIYHRCALNVDHYEVVIDNKQLINFLKHKDIMEFVKNGWIIFTLKGNKLPRINKGNVYWQGMYENMALLRHWQTKNHLMVHNVDEYVVYNNSFNSAIEFKEKVLGDLEPGAVGMKRFMAFGIKSGSALKPDLPQLSFTSNSYVLADKLRDLKLILNPNRTGCMIMHWAGCGTGYDHQYKKNENIKYPKPEIAFIAHFENMCDVRWKGYELEKRIAGTMNQFMAFNFTKLNVMQRCDPHSIYDFKEFKSNRSMNVNHGKHYQRGENLRRQKISSSISLHH